MSSVPPHLLFDARHLDGRGSGLSRYIEELAHALPDVCGCTVTLVSPRAITPRMPFRGVCVHVDQGWSTRLPGTLWLTARVPALMRHLAGTHFLGTQHTLPLGKPEGMRYGLLMHDLVYQRFPATMTWSNRWLARAFVPRSLAVADIVFSVSASTQEDIRRTYPGLKARMEVAYPGISLADHEAPAVAKTSCEPLRLLFVGSLEPRKNLPALVKAFAVARARGLIATLDVVSGTGWGADDLPGLLHGTDGIHLHQGVTDAQLQALYRQADWLVFPSLYEGFGLPITEALDKCAVLANDIPVFRELSGMIDGMSFVDFSAPTTEVAAALLNLDRRAPARLRHEADRQRLSWTHCARVICAGLDLPIRES